MESASDGLTEILKERNLATILAAAEISEQTSWIVSSGFLPFGLCR